MNKLRFAIVEDNIHYIEKYKKLLAEIPDVTVDFAAFSAKEFFESDKKNDVDALLLDIDLEYPEAGLEVAQETTKPVMFISTYSAKYLTTINKMREDGKIVVPIMKEAILNPDSFKKQVLRFCNEIRQSSPTLKLETSEGFVTINVGDISYIASEKESNNGKTIYFTNRKKIGVSRKEFQYFNDISPRIVQIHKTFMVNLDNIIGQKGGEVLVKVFMQDNSEKGETTLPVSENYKNNLI
ncbi:MAG: LytTR family transcriptional regulator DNA-binding domain-containing protein [Bacteroidales bacterium]|nr:LytTR family transcriptional regulator DNA-binding domain-containing protein [Bacteroidales bacterium]